MKQPEKNASFPWRNSQWSTHQPVKILTHVTIVEQFQVLIDRFISKSKQDSEQAKKEVIKITKEHDECISTMEAV